MILNFLIKNNISLYIVLYSYLYKDFFISNMIFINSIYKFNVF